MELFKELIKKEWFRLLSVLLIGVTIGAVFYPTKHIEEKVSQKYEQELTTQKQTYEKTYSELNEKYSSLQKENKELHVQSEQKITKLTEEVKSLQSKQKTAFYKLVKPDGTVEIKKFTESEVNESTKVISKIQEEFKVKIDQIETKWSTIHQERVSKLQKDFESREAEYKKTIASYEYSKVSTTNPKRFGLEAGIMSNKNYYGHVTIDMWGPVFVGVQGELGPEDTNKLGAGIGLRF